MLFEQETENHPVEELQKNTEEQMQNTRQFFDRIAFLQLSDKKKSEAAKEIISTTFNDKLYRLTLILSSLMAGLGLLTNSVPVIIGAMLVAPILQPIKAFAFAVSTGSKSIYLKALKMLGLSILVAVIVSYLITRAVPFADITSEILSRTSPTIVDLFIALASGVIAVLSLGFKKLSESIAGVAMAVALMPPLCVIGIGLQLLNWDITLGSTLLFLTNLVAIIVVGIMIFYAFGFFPTNKKGQKRSATMSILVILTIAILTVPLRKGMQTIGQNYKTNIILNDTFDNFLETIDPKIEFTEIDYKKSEDKTLRINATLTVPDTIQITNEHRNELTQHLALATQNSVELELKIIDVSSVYIDTPQEPSKEELLKNWASTKVQDFTGLLLIDIKVAKQPKTVALITLFNQGNIEKNIIFDSLENQVHELFGEESTLLIQRQKNGKEEIKDKKEFTTIEEDIVHEQFDLLFSDAELISLTLNFGNVLSGGINSSEFNSGTFISSGTSNTLYENIRNYYSGDLKQYNNIHIDLNFSSPNTPYQTKKLLENRKNILSYIFQTNIIISVKVNYFSDREM